jgi:hypothetical protein
VFWLRSRFPLNVKRPQEWELIEWTHSREPWDRRIYALKIHEIDWVFQALQLLAKFRTEPRVSCLHGCARTPLSLTERKVSGYVGDGLDAHFFKLLGSTSVESWQIPNVVVWERRIAAVEKLARDRIGAMGTHWYWRRLRKSQYSKFRPKQESELGQQPLDSSG